MLKRLFYTCSIMVLAAGCSTPEKPVAPEPQVVVITKTIVDFPVILFEAGSVTLSLRARQQIRELSTAIKKSNRDDDGLLVEGHTDFLGNEKSNHAVSLQRAEAVARELMFNGIARERISVRAYGETRPAVPNTLPDGSDNPEGRAANRRVETAWKDGA